MNTFYFNTSLAFIIPEELVREIKGFMPRHDTAQILVDAFKVDKLRLKYVGWIDNIDTPSKKYSSQERKIIAPSVIKSTLYGDEEAPMFIMRTDINMGEKLRLRIAARQCI
jgi:hypothetical protein